MRQKQQTPFPTRPPNQAYQLLGLVIEHKYGALCAYLLKHPQTSVGITSLSVAL